MTKKEILDAIHGKMIISCQAVEGEPLYVEEKSIMYLMARAAKQAGTPAIRTSSIRDVIAIKEETGLPVIGLVIGLVELADDGPGAVLGPVVDQQHPAVGGDFARLDHPLHLGLEPPGGLGQHLLLVVAGYHDV